MGSIFNFSQRRVLRILFPLEIIRKECVSTVIEENRYVTEKNEQATHKVIKLDNNLFNNVRIEYDACDDAKNKLIMNTKILNQRDIMIAFL